MDQVKRRLRKLLRPNMGLYFAVLVLFCAAALYVGRYWLAAAEAVATLLVFLIFTMAKNYRDKKLKQYVQSMSNTLEGMGQGESPFPAVLVRLATARSSGPTISSAG